MLRSLVPAGWHWRAAAGAAPSIAAAAQTARSRPPAAAAPRPAAHALPPRLAQKVQMSSLYVLLALEQSQYFWLAYFLL